MVSKELEQLLNGEQGYSRNRAPEPLLLPRIASRIVPESLGYVAYVADVLSCRWAPNGWLALADATAETIASRHLELSDGLLQELCSTLVPLPLALSMLGGAAGQRVEKLIGSDAANRLRTGPANPVFFLREAVSRYFKEPDQPHTADELMVLIRDQVESERPEMQRNLLAYFLPLAPAEHHPWMLSMLVKVLGVDPGWNAAAAASRVAGFLDPAAIEQAGASLEDNDSPWAAHVRDLLAGGPAPSVLLEVARALPYDGRLESLLASETDPASLTGFVDGILDGWGGAPAPKMARMESFEAAGDDDAGAEELPPEPPSLARSAPPPASLPRSAPPPPPQRASRSRSAPPAASEPEAVRAEQSVPERRLQAQVFADDQGALIPVRQGFMKGARHDVRLWIGPQTRHAINADTAISEPTPDEQELQTGSMEIFITLVHGSKLQTHSVGLPIDRAKRSNAAVFSVEVEQNARFVSAEVWLQHKGRVFQYLKLDGLTLDEPDAITDGIELRVESLVRALPEDASGNDFEMAMVKKDDKYIVFGPRGAEKTEVSLQGSRDVVTKINKTLFNTTKALVRHSADNRGTSWVGDHDEEAMKLLRKMARYGNLLYQHLKNEGILERISETIQFVNLDETDIVPIEYVYDKGYPRDGSTLCEGFREAEDWNEIFATGQCTCSNQPFEESNSLCPMGFWSLSKIIERQPRPRGAAKAASGTDFTAPSGSSPGIALTRRAMLAAAPNVNGLDVDSIKSMLDETYSNRYKHATDWEDWKAEIKEKSPKLLILLPHHGGPVDDNLDFLEIGSQVQAKSAKLHAGVLNEVYVTSKLDEPGPVVLLLGCETAQSELLPFHTFARDFLANHASVVVATQASVLGQHAAPVANEFIRQLLAATHVGGSFGKIMRDVRRKMFSAGYLMSLALVSFGDSDWKLADNTPGEDDVSH